MCGGGGGQPAGRGPHGPWQKNMDDVTTIWMRKRGRRGTYGTTSPRRRGERERWRCVGWLAACALASALVEAWSPAAGRGARFDLPAARHSSQDAGPVRRDGRRVEDEAGLGPPAVSRVKMATES
ncbi:hypothetical protein ABZP36_002894 [Zizania latifolia]